jgi:hypothetical protein
MLQSKGQRHRAKDANQVAEDEMPERCFAGAFGSEFELNPGPRIGNHESRHQQKKYKSLHSTNIPAVLLLSSGTAMFRFNPQWHSKTEPLLEFDPLQCREQPVELGTKSQTRGIGVIPFSTASLSASFLVMSVGG